MASTTDDKLALARENQRATNVEFLKGEIEWIPLPDNSVTILGSPTSFANPAVAVARSFTDPFSGIRPNDLPGFIAAQFLGAVCAMAVATWLLRETAEAVEPMNVEAQL